VVGAIACCARLFSLPRLQRQAFVPRADRSAHAHSFTCLPPPRCCVDARAALNTAYRALKLKIWHTQASPPVKHLAADGVSSLRGVLGEQGGWADDGRYLASLTIITLGWDVTAGEGDVW